MSAKQFECRVRCVVYKSVTVECETKEQARSQIWEFAVSERETDQVDWDVESVTEIPQ